MPVRSGDPGLPPNQLHNPARSRHRAQDGKNHARHAPKVHFVDPVQQPGANAGAGEGSDQQQQQVARIEQVMPGLGCLQAQPGEVGHLDKVPDRLCKRFGRDDFESIEIALLKECVKKRPRGSDEQLRRGDREAADEGRERASDIEPDAFGGQDG